MGALVAGVPIRCAAQVIGGLLGGHARPVGHREVAGRWSGAGSTELSEPELFLDPVVEGLVDEQLQMSAAAHGDIPPAVTARWRVGATTGRRTALVDARCWHDPPPSDQHLRASMPGTAHRWCRPPLPSGCHDAHPPPAGPSITSGLYPERPRGHGGEDRGVRSDRWSEGTIAPARVR